MKDKIYNLISILALGMSIFALVSNDRQMLFAGRHVTTGNATNTGAMYVSGDLAVGGEFNLSGNVSMSNATNTGSLYVTKDLAVEGAMSTSTSIMRAYKSSTSYITPEEYILIDFDAEDYDPYNEYDSASTYRFTATSSGYFFVHANIEWASSTVDDVYGVTIFKNGAAHAETYVTSKIIYDIRQSVSDIIQMDAGDYIEIFAYQGTSGTEKAIAGSTEKTYLNIFKLFD